MEMDATVDGALRIYRWIVNGALKEFSVQSCFCFHQSHFRRVDGPCINLLERHGYIAGESRKKGAVTKLPDGARISHAPVSVAAMVFERARLIASSPSSR